MADYAKDVLVEPEWLEQHLDDEVRVVVAAQAALLVAVEGCSREKCFQLFRILRQAFELLPFMACANALLGSPLLHLCHRHQAGMVVLVALHRQPDTLDSVGDEAHWAVVIDGFERLDHAGHVVAAEIGHQRQQFVVAALVDHVVIGPGVVGGGVADRVDVVWRV